jgi:hypothetical protein
MGRPRRNPVRIAGVIAASAAVLVLLATAVLAQQMNFRPLPPESLDRITSGAPPTVVVHAPGRAGKGGLDIRIDSTGAMVNLPGAGVAAPAVPPVPEPPATRETTGEIVRFGSDIHVLAGQVVEGDVVSMGGSVRVDGTVRGSVTSMGGDVSLGSGARVDGDVVCLGGTLREDLGSSVGGQHVTAPRVPGSHFLLPMLSVVGTGVRMVTHFFMMLVMMGIAFVIVKLAPGRTQTAVDTMRANAGASFVLGLLIWGLIVPSVVVIALAVAVLAITIIGIPVAIALLVGYALLLVVLFVWGAVSGYALLGGYLHERLRGGSASLVRAAMTGILALYGLRIAGDVLHVVPLFGFLGGFLNVIAIVVGVLLATLGAGALVRMEYRRRTVQDWWSRSRPGRPVTRPDDFPPPPAPEAAPAPAPPPPPPPPPPSPPSAFQPPPPTDPPSPVS